MPAPSKKKFSGLKGWGKRGPLRGKGEGKKGHNQRSRRHGSGNTSGKCAEGAASVDHEEKKSRKKEGGINLGASYDECPEL